MNLLNFPIILSTLFCVVKVQSLECYECQSDAEPDCAIKPGKQIDVTECPENDKCVIIIGVNGATHRGCFSSVVTNGYCPEKTCKSCETPLCNEGLFPSDRLKCIQCKGGIDCMNVTASNFYKPQPCQYYEEKGRCFTNIIDKKKIERGCVTKQMERNCENICLKCNYDGCNNESGTYNSTCQLCEYRHGPWTTPRNYDCKRSQTYDNEIIPENYCSVHNISNTCSQVVLYGHKEKCFIHWDEKENSLKRGCSSTKNMWPTAEFWECYGDNCNSDCIDIQCNVCQSETDPLCKIDTSKLKYQKCPKETVSCFSCENMDGILRRGCGFAKSSESEKCYHCFDENGCNKNVTRTCYKCTSTTEPNCSDWKDISKIEHEQCKDVDEQCVVTRTSKYVVRGCESTTTECTSGDPDCKRCNGSLCNMGLYRDYN